jgi:hypothetical protein
MLRIGLSADRQRPTPAFSMVYAQHGTGGGTWHPISMFRRLKTARYDPSNASATPLKPGFTGI